ncbi:MAG TPA: 16S rRNA (guanine(527)-N(7))-methyltransferase RsmG [Terracidiphilus sp.]|nr:16S rRNA (guanine(527)-N(7))-methyltransferase RsmG [Terracidiphilus sp.]
MTSAPSAMSDPTDISVQLQTLLASAGLESIQTKQNKQLNDYFALLERWNRRVNLTAIRDPEGILARHFVESIAAAQALPAAIATLLDFGSGAGFPGIPIAICRPEIAVTLAESQGKKAAFLREAVRTLGLGAQVHAARAETLTIQFDCVTLRAVDRMQQAVSAAARLVRSGGWLAPLITTAGLPALEAATGAGFIWRPPTPLPGSDRRILALARASADLSGN